VPGSGPDFLFAFFTPQDLFGIFQLTDGTIIIKIIVYPAWNRSCYFVFFN